jgi:hypothetical protein
MLTGLILAGCLWFGLFVVLRFEYRARPGRTSRRRIQATPWRGHLHIEAPSESEAVDELLRADYELAKRGQ